MPTKDPRVDAYIARCAEFAQPILKHLRRVVHAASPAIEETMKWGMPFFVHRGIVCNMAAFKQHCSFGFWRSDLVLDGDPRYGQAGGGMMQRFGRLTTLSDLPSDRQLTTWVRKAVELNAAGVKLPARPKPKKKPLIVPPDLRAALRKNKKAAAAFAEFSYSHKKEYVDWITEAKRDETRQKRLATALTWMAGGKSRHWKYANC